MASVVTHTHSMISSTGSVNSELSDAADHVDVSDPHLNGCCNNCWNPRREAGGTGQSCQRKCCIRAPIGKSLGLVLALTVIGSFVFFEALSGLSKSIFAAPPVGSKNQSKWTYLVAPVAIDSVGKLFYPIGGFVADVWLGRKRVIHISMWLLWASLILLTITVLIELGTNGLTASSYYALITVVFVLFSIGIGGFETNMIPLGADQLQGASAEELSSYFYWYYWSKQVGALIGILTFFFFEELRYAPFKVILDNGTLVNGTLVNRTYGTSVMEPFVATFFLSIGIVLYVCFNNWLNEDASPNNPLKLIINVTYYALTVTRGPPRFRRAFRYGEERKSRFELAKKDFDGIYENEEVENVKTFYQICMVLVSYIFFSSTYGIVSMVCIFTYTYFDFFGLQVFEALDYQAFHLLTTVYNTSSDPGLYFISQNLGSLFNECGLVVVLPIVNFASSFVCSSSLYSKRSLRVKMGFGYFFLLLSSLILFCVARFHSIPTPLVSLLLLLVPAVFLFLSEMFGMVTRKEICGTRLSFMM